MSKAKDKVKGKALGKKGFVPFKKKGDKADAKDSKDGKKKFVPFWLKGKGKDEKK
jgi:hypothetical protein